MMAPARRRRWLFPSRRRAALVSPDRHRIMPPARTLRALGLRRGMTLLDVGCGNGFFCVPACRVVGPRGTVLACDTSPVMLREARSLAGEAGAANLDLRRCRDPEIPFEDGTADFALLAFVLHETASVRRLLAETRRVLRPGGRAVLAEWHKRPTEMGPPLWARFRPPELERALRGAGFAVNGCRDFDGNTYFVTARPARGK